MWEHGSGKGRWTRSFRVVLLACLVTLVPVALGGCKTTKTSDKNIELVDIDEAVEMSGARKGVLGIGKSKGAIWVDSRSAAKYIVSHIPGARHIPYEEIRDRHGELSGYGLVIVYGEAYNSPDAIGMSKTLIELGYDVRTLRGGLRAWVAEGNEVETGLGEG